MPLFHHHAVGIPQSAHEIQRTEKCKRKAWAMEVEGPDHPIAKREKIDYQCQQLCWDDSVRLGQVDIEPHVQDHETKSLGVEESMDFHGYQPPTCVTPPAQIVSTESQEPSAMVVTESEMLSECPESGIDSGRSSNSFILEDGGEICSTRCPGKAPSPVSKTAKCSHESLYDEPYYGYDPPHYLSDYY